MRKSKEAPFVFGVRVEGDSFTDRREETERLKANFTYGVNTILISPRRMGKTSLVDKVCSLVESEDIRIARIDAFGCRSENDFINAFATAVVRATSSKWEEWMENAKVFLSRFVPKISIGQDPLTDFSLALEYNAGNNTTEEVLRLPEMIARSKGCHIVVCIDEFQQIAEYPEKGTEALLRSYIQFAQHVHFIFSGSKHHLMAEIFGSPKHPFYQSTEMMGLKPLDCSIYYDFCQNFFKQKGGNLSKDTFDYIYQQFEGHTWYIQCIMNRLYETEIQVDSIQQVNAAILSVLEGREPQFENMVQFFTENQFSLLKAIAKDSIVAQPTSGKFIKEHKLSGASSVKAALKILEDKELVYRTNKGYIIYDRFMDLWLKRI